MRTNRPATAVSWPEGMVPVGPTSGDEIFIVRAGIEGCRLEITDLYLLNEEPVSTRIELLAVRGSDSRILAYTGAAGDYGGIVHRLATSILLRDGESFAIRAVSSGARIVGGANGYIW